jgi:hypothetical protein
MFARREFRHYRNCDLRTAAIKRIVAALSVDGFGPKEVASEFRNLRNYYSQGGYAVA